MNRWLSQHRAAFGLALRRLGATPFNTLLSLLAIGIALTLPAFGYVALDNLRNLGGSASGVQQISVFMDVGASREAVADTEKRLRALSTARITFVSRDEALKRLQTSEGMAEIVASLPRNPLPDAFIVEPANLDPDALEVLRKELAGWPRVAHVQLDSAWVKRFDAFLRLGKLALLMLAGLFGAGLIAVTFNTIRLQVMAQAAEIEVARMIGATDGFIRRPFLYFGALQGALGGLIAAGLVAGALRLLNGPVGELAALYGGDFALRLPAVPEIAALAGIGAVLGWVGAQLSVGLSLRRFD
ncbi:MAG: permease-like cell division protein FtsX [Azonexaceae bacterium]|uniref:permease-like cell division protein FtsX n=1 Tax=Azonexus sp. R2A61 TaxID=2744443 RepID=UPI001F1C2E96|nr:permease-like cell division protein FtsX [Azonexus sp. R2A61]MCE1239883.1 permease-like cell division protein FtsX [Azonexaceae bacterium]